MGEALIICDEYDDLDGYITYIGQGTQSLDVSQILPDIYHNLTTDNFIIQPQAVSTTNRTSGASIAEWRSIDGSGNFKHEVVKSYDAETGILTFHEYNYDHNGSDDYGGAWVTSSNYATCDVYVYSEDIAMQLSASKLKTGTGSTDTVNIGELNNFEEYTADDFIVGITSGNSGTYTYRYSGHDDGDGDDDDYSRTFTSTSSFSISKSYNQQTGVFAFSISANRNNTFGYEIYLKEHE